MTVDPSSTSDPTTLPGPWLCGFTLRVPLVLRSKSNFRRHRGGVSTSGSWGNSQNFERSLGLLVRSARPANWVLGERDDTVAARPVVVAFLAARSTIDVANYSKSVLDACENVLYVTDASVLGVTSVGLRGHGQELLVGFAQLAPGATLEEINDALSSLSSSTLSTFPLVV